MKPFIFKLGYYWHVVYESYKTWPGTNLSQVVHRVCISWKLALFVLEDAYQYGDVR